MCTVDCCLFGMAERREAQTTTVILSSTTRRMNVWALVDMTRWHVSSTCAALKARKWRQNDAQMKWHHSPKPYGLWRLLNLSVHGKWLPFSVRQPAQATPFLSLAKNEWSQNDFTLKNSKQKMFISDNLFNELSFNYAISRSLIFPVASRQRRY